MKSIILGPPGTGKTTKLISLVEDALARGVPPDRVGYFSFTVKAASEATSRASRKFSLDRKSLPHFSTLHSMCYRQLGMKRSDVFAGKKLQEFAAWAGVDISGNVSQDGTSAGQTVGDRLLFTENLSRIRCVPLEEMHSAEDDGLQRHKLTLFAKKLREFKEKHQVLDFTDMLTSFLRSGVRLRLEELFVDESQDLSKLQWRVVERLSEGCSRVAVAGDDDQAIYRWAGADVDHLIDMAGDAEVLGQSYRVPRTIQEIANKLIRRVRNRRDKEWLHRSGAEGVVDRKFSFQKVNVDSGETLILARNTYVIGDQIEPWLRRQGLLYRTLPHDNWSIPKKLLGAVYDWEALRKGRKITIECARKIYSHMRVDHGVKRGYKSLPRMEDDEMVGMADLRERCGLLRDDPWHEAFDNVEDSEQVTYIKRALQRGEKLRETPRITLSTIHGSKGGEADHVVVMKEMAYRTFVEMDRNMEDELRVWYVAVTRARERLTLVEPHSDSDRMMRGL